MYLIDTIRPLSITERQQVANIMPQANLNHSKHLGDEGYIALERFTFLASNPPSYDPFDDHSSNPLCAQYSCIDYRENFRIFLKKNNSTLTKLEQKVSRNELKLSEACSKKGVECEITISKVASFNCIGWALGISKQINFDSHNPRSDLPNFLSKSTAKYPADHPSNFLNITSSLQLLNDLPTPVLNNTLALYFRDGGLFHASRYVTSLNGIDINQWTSKFGSGFIATHDEVNINDRFYGSEIYFLGIQEPQGSLVEIPVEVL